MIKSRNPNKINKEYNQTSPLIGKTNTFHEVDELDEINFKHGIYTEHEAHIEKVGENNYDILHDISNFIIESGSRLDLLRKIETLSHILIKICEENNIKKSEDIIQIILLRLQGKTFKQINEITGIYDRELSAILKNVNDEKILLVLKTLTETNKHKGGKSLRGKQELE
jgi:uncharacterized protein YerC